MEGSVVVDVTMGDLPQLGGSLQNESQAEPPVMKQLTMEHFYAPGKYELQLEPVKDVPA